MEPLFQFGKKDKFMIKAPRGKNKDSTHRQADNRKLRDDTQKEKTATAEEALEKIFRLRGKKRIKTTTILEFLLLTKYTKVRNKKSMIHVDLNRLQHSP